MKAIILEHILANFGLDWGWFRVVLVGFSVYVGSAFSEGLLTVAALAEDASWAWPGTLCFS